MKPEAMMQPSTCAGLDGVVGYHSERGRRGGGITRDGVVETAAALDCHAERRANTELGMEVTWALAAGDTAPK